MSETRPRRGRPRPQENIERDETIYDLLKNRGPKTRNEVAQETGLTHSLTYLALDRLRRSGRVRRCLTDDSGSVWSVETDSPCP
jgi:hypothetical protein